MSDKFENEYVDINSASSDEEVDVYEEEDVSSENTDEESTKKKKTPLSVVVFEWAQSMINAIIVVIILLTFVFRLINVDGRSMQDTLQSGDKVLVTGFTSDYKYGDIIVVSRGTELEKVLIKRVIATAGQIVDIDTDSGNVMVDNVILDEKSYLKDPTGTHNLSDVDFPVTVPEGMLFVLGDNRAVSKDSRSSEVGFIDLDNVIGKAQYVIYPFENFKKLY